jgi:hypothetical protein
MMNFATREGWRYFRNTWITATVVTAALGASCSLTRPAFAADTPPSAHPQQVIASLVWTDKQQAIMGSEVIGLAPDPETCFNITLEEAAKHSDDFEANAKKGWLPHLTCGIPVPDKVFYGDAPVTPPAAPHKQNDRCATPEADLLIQGCHRFDTGS